MTETPQTNWAGNLTYSAENVRKPGTVAELQEIVRGATKLRAIGSRHSFNNISDTPDTLVVLSGLDQVTNIDASAKTVTAEGGITYGQLGPKIEAEGFALPNLASLPHISVAGACATGTHGSGVANQSLASAVSGMKIVTASGDLLTLSRGDADFDGAVIALGGLGIVAEVTLDLCPSFAIRQDIYTGLPLAALADDFAEISAAAYSTSFFTDWQSGMVFQAWLKNNAQAPASPETFFGAQRATGPVHPIPALDPSPCTEQMGVPGRWLDRLPHFRMDFAPSLGAELQSEYFVPRAQASEAIRALTAIGDTIAGPLLTSEIRNIAADKYWLSPYYEQDTVAFHFTWQRDWLAVREVLPAVEKALAPFGVRAHWGKLFTLSPAEVQAGYPRLNDYRALLTRVDPAGKFRNKFIDTYIF